MTVESVDPVTGNSPQVEPEKGHSNNGFSTGAGDLGGSCGSLQKSIQNISYATNGEEPPKYSKGPENSTNHDQDDYDLRDLDDDVRCGYGSFRPSPLQFMCNRPRVLLLWLCLFAFLQGFVVNGINNVNTTSIERRFSLKSSNVGLISAMYDIAAGILVLPVTYFATHGHQPRMLSMAAVSLTIGTSIMFIPHFATDIYQLGNSVSDTCDLIGNQTVCTEESNSYSESLQRYLYVFLLGMFLNGLGGTTLYTVGYVLIDSNVRNTDAGLYQGIMLGASTVGPAAGYIIGGYFLDTYVDFEYVDTSSVDIKPEDQRWVGAWWLGFLIAAFFLIPVIFGLFPYPRELPEGRRLRKYRVSQAHQGSSRTLDSVDSSSKSSNKNGPSGADTTEVFLESWRMIPSSLKVLFMNPVLMLVTLGTLTDGMIVTGFATFLPKFVQNQFSQTTSSAAFYAGAIVVVGAVIGNLSAGIIIKVFKLRVIGMLRLCLIVTVASVFAGLAILARCDTRAIAGVTQSYLGTATDISLNVSCNSACHCSTRSYEPICGNDGVQYFSPCHAACLYSGEIIDGDQKKIAYFNCSCIDPGVADDNGALAVEGVCSTDCSLLYVFVPFFFLVVILLFMATVGALNVTLRCVTDEQRSFALGIQAVCVRFLGTVPGPLLFGAVFDSHCISWQDDCGTQGSCWIYDNKKLSVSVLILALVLRFLSITWFSIAHYIYTPPPIAISHPDIQVNFDKMPPGGDEDTQTSPSVTISSKDIQNGAYNPGFEGDNGSASPFHTTVL